MQVKRYVVIENTQEGLSKTITVNNIDTGTSVRMLFSFLNACVYYYVVLSLPHIFIAALDT